MASGKHVYAAPCRTMSIPLAQIGWRYYIVLCSAKNNLVPYTYCSSFSRCSADKFMSQVSRRRAEGMHIHPPYGEEHDIINGYNDTQH